MDAQVQRVLDSLRVNGFAVHYVESGARARELILDMIPQDARVGIGDSLTLRQIGILNDLENRGTSLVDPPQEGVDGRPHQVRSVDGNRAENAGH